MALLLLFFRRSLSTVAVRRSALLGSSFIAFLACSRSCFSFLYRSYTVFLVRLAVRLGFRRARLGIFVGVDRGSRV